MATKRKFEVWGVLFKYPEHDWDLEVDQIFLTREQARNYCKWEVINDFSTTGLKMKPIRLVSEE